MAFDIFQNKVSIIIPTYNRATFLPNAVNSILEQRCNNIEIIIIDDGSEDNTKDVVGTLKRKHPDIILCNNERSKGPSGARNTGIIKSSGDILSFLDSDDIWLEDHLKNGLRILNEYPEIDVLFGNFNVVDLNTGEHLYNFFDKKDILHTLRFKMLSYGVKLLQDNLFKALIQENFFLLGSVLIRKSALNDILLDESISFAEDRDLAIKLYKEANATFAYRQESVFIQYRHDSNIYHPGDINNWRNVIKAELYLYTKYIFTYNPSKNEKNIMEKLIFRRLLSLSYTYRMSKKYKKALLTTLKSFKYKLSLKQLREIIMIFLTAILTPKFSETISRLKARSL